MSALACLLQDLGNEVVGSDYPNQYFTDQILEERKIKIYNFNEAKVDASYIYIIGLAFNEDNDDVKKIKKNHYKYYYYNDFIGHELNMDIIGVSGTHGKTTTTTFLSQMLNNNVSYIIGDGTGKGIKESNKLVLEACEYKNHFLAYQPEILLINNIELDHPDFFKNINEVVSSFQKIVDQSKIAVVNGDDINIKRLTFNKVIKVGQDQTNDVIFKVIKTNKEGTFINIKEKNKIYAVFIPFFGIHLVYDFVMAYVACRLLGVNPHIQDLTLPKRRMTEHKYGKTILIDDYGHHPTEIKSLYNSIKEKYHNYKINVIFQPHTYSRTLTLKKEFKEALSLFDAVYLDKVFPSSREEESTFKQLKINKIFKKYRSFTPSIIDLINPNNSEVWVFLGAGTINGYIKKVIGHK